MKRVLIVCWVLGLCVLACQTKDKQTNTAVEAQNVVEVSKEVEAPKIETGVLCIEASCACSDKTIEAGWSCLNGHRACAGLEFAGGSIGKCVDGVYQAPVLDRSLTKGYASFPENYQRILDDPDSNGWKKEYSVLLSGLFNKYDELKKVRIPVTFGKSVYELGVNTTVKDGKAYCKDEALSWDLIKDYTCLDQGWKLFNWTCTNEAGCACGSEQCSAGQVCEDGKCTVKVAKCVDGNCPCGDDFCGKNAYCIDNSCVCAEENWWYEKTRLIGGEDEDGSSRNENERCELRPCSEKAGTCITNDEDEKVNKIFECYDEQRDSCLMEVCWNDEDDEGHVNEDKTKGMGEFQCYTNFSYGRFDVAEYEAWYFCDKPDGCHTPQGLHYPRGQAYESYAHLDTGFPVYAGARTVCVLPRHDGLKRMAEAGKDATEFVCDEKSCACQSATCQFGEICRNGACEKDTCKVTPEMIEDVEVQVDPGCKDEEFWGGATELEECERKTVKTFHDPECKNGTLYYFTEDGELINRPEAPKDSRGYEYTTKFSDLEEVPEWYCTSLGCICGDKLCPMGASCREEVCRCHDQVIDELPTNEICLCRSNGLLCIDRSSLDQ